MRDYLEMSAENSRTEAMISNEDDNNDNHDDEGEKQREKTHIVFHVLYFWQCTFQYLLIKCTCIYTHIGCLRANRSILCNYVAHYCEQQKRIVGKTAGANYKLVI